MGRPRDTDIDDRLLVAVRTLLAERGYDAMTMEAIAQEAGVGKAALYRRFSSKAQVAFQATAREAAPRPLPDTGRFLDDMVESVQRLVATLRVAPRAAMADQIAESIRDPDFAALVEERMIGRRQIHELWARAVARGEIDPEADGHTALSDLSAVVQWHVLQFHRDLSHDDVVDLVRRWAHGYAR